MLELIQNNKLHLLKTFMKLFGTNKFKVVLVSEHLIQGIVYWPYDGEQMYYDEDDEKQEISWKVVNWGKELVNDIIDIINLLINEKLTDNDKILINENELFKLCQVKLNWSKQKFSRVLEYLLRIDVRMIDDGEETDSFFLHF